MIPEFQPNAMEFKKKELGKPSKSLTNLTKINQIPIQKFQVKDLFLSK